MSDITVINYNNYTVTVIDDNKSTVMVLDGAGPRGATGSPTTASNVVNVPAGNISSEDVQSALNELDTEKLGVDSLSANISLYPTSVASDIGGYYKLVSSINHTDYDDPAVDINTGQISATDQLISSLAYDPGLITGDPGIINVTIIGNIKRLSGTGTATFHFRLFHRTSVGVETEIAESSATAAVSLSSYVQFSAAALLNNGNFLPTDRLVIKFYGNRLALGTDPVYNFQFGGDTPVRALVPLPLNVLPKTILGQYDTRPATLTATNGSTVTLNFNSGNWFLIDASGMAAGQSFTIAISNLPTNALTSPAWRIIIKTGVNLPTISWPDQDPLVDDPVVVVSASNEIIGRNYNETPNYNVHTLGQVLT